LVQLERCSPTLPKIADEHRCTARYGAMEKARVASGSAIAQLHQVPGHDP
jgi:hypothetical protein